MVKRITLFDGFTVTLGDKPLPKLVSRKADVLLAYLAHEQRPFTREQAATLLWQDSSQKQALSNLRTLLSSLRKHAGDFVTITRQTVAIKPDVWVDTAVFQQQLTLAQNNWPDTDAIAQAEDALTLYRGEFLDGILIDNSFELESWMQTSRDHLRHLANNARQKLIDHYLQQGDYTSGIKHAHALLQEDPLDEAAHRQMMTLLARSGQRGAAIEQYQTCCRILDAELGVEPDDETTALLRRIELADDDLTANLPASPTTFIGRAQERLQISQLLQNEDVRLLTLIGLGGIGKTRLAIQIGHDLASRFLNGIYYVPLAPIQSPDFLISAIAEATQLHFSGSGSPKTQLFNHLRPKETLLILDNFEHLLAGARLLDEILQNAPHITLLITSRERLQLRAEHLFEISGLSCPSRADSPAANPPMAAYDSLHLFRDRARLMDINFELTAENYDCVSQICNLLQGMPLGIEMAAAWTRAFSCSQILTQIEQNIGFLATQMRDVPERHRSLRAVFDYVWELLSPDERSLFLKLSLFRGGFTIEAATAVAAMSPWTLVALVEKLLLRKQKDDRYEMLEVMRRFAATMSTADETAMADGRIKHARYYANFMTGYAPLLNGRRTKDALKAIAVELENVHAAWSYAITQIDFEIAADIMPALTLYYVYKGPYQEGLGLVNTAVAQFTAVAESTPHPTTAQADLLAKLYAVQSNLYDLTSNYDEAIAAARQAIKWGEIGQNIHNQAVGYWRWGWNCSRKGEYDKAVTYAQKGLEMAQAAGSQQEEAASAYVMSLALVRQGQLSCAAEYAQRAYTLFRAAGNRWEEARTLNMLGIAHWYLGGHSKAKAYYQQALLIYEEVGNVEGFNTATGNIALAAVFQRNYEEAHRLYQQILRMYRFTGNRWSESWTLNNLGTLSIERMNFEDALRYCREAAQVAVDASARFNESYALHNMGLTYWRLGEYAHSDSYYQQSLAIQAEMKEAHGSSISFHDRSLLAHDMGDMETALAFARQALAIGDTSEDKLSQASALTALGNVLTTLGDCAEAEAAYHRALPIWTSLQRPHCAIDTQAGLVRVALAQGDTAVAITVTNEILKFLDEDSLEGILSPFGAYLACVQALQAADDPRLDEVLAKAKSTLQETAVSIQNPSLRKSYLQNVPTHRILQAM